MSGPEPRCLPSDALPLCPKSTIDHSSAPPVQNLRLLALAALQDMPRPLRDAGHCQGRLRAALLPAGGCCYCGQAFPGLLATAPGIVKDGCVPRSCQQVSRWVLPSVVESFCWAAGNSAGHCQGGVHAALVPAGRGVFPALQLVSVGSPCTLSWCGLHAQPAAVCEQAL